VIALGLGLIAAANLTLVPFDGSAAAVPFCMALGGVGIGLSAVAATATGTDVRDDLQGVASGVLNTAAQLGTALGVAAILLVAALSGGSGGPAAGAPAGWVGAGLLAVAGVAFFAPRRSGADLSRPDAARPGVRRPDADREQVRGDHFEQPPRKR
jgi:hypothetical protein